MEWYVKTNFNMADRPCSVSSNLCAFDRFIPYRRNLDVESSHARLTTLSTSGPPDNDLLQFKSPTRKSYKRRLSKSLLSTPASKSVLPIRCSTPTSTLYNYILFLSNDSIKPSFSYYSWQVYGIKESSILIGLINVIDPYCFVCEVKRITERYETISAPNIEGKINNSSTGCT